MGYPRALEVYAVGIPFTAKRTTLAAVCPVRCAAATPKPPLSNVVPPLLATEHLVRNPAKSPAWELPVVVPPFEERVRNLDVEVFEAAVTAFTGESIRVYRERRL